MLRLNYWKKILFHYDTKPTEIQSLAYLVGTSIWVTISIAQGYSSPVLATLSKVAHPVIWLVLVLSCSSYKYFSLKLNKVKPRIKAAKFACVLWTAISYALWKAGGNGSFLYIYPIVAFSEIWTYLNLSVKEKYRFILNDLSITDKKEEIIR